MIDTQTIDRLAERVGKVIPPGFDAARKDLHENIRDVLQRGLRELELVTREEFDVQVAVLAKTRAQLDELEQRLASMEDTNQQGS